MVRLEKKCKECEKIEVSEVKIRPIFDSSNWVCRDCRLKINERINKEREEEERKYKLLEEEKRAEKEKWERLLNSESVSKLEDIMEKNCYRFPGKCSTWKCSSGDKIVFAKSNEIKALDRWGEAPKPTLYCGKCYLNYDHEGRIKKDNLIRKDIIDNDINTNCDNCNKKIPGRDWHLWRGYYRDGINKTGILCRDCKDKEIDKLATYEKEEKPMITESGEKSQPSSQPVIVKSKSVISQNENGGLVNDLKKQVKDLQMEVSDKNRIIRIQTKQIKELQRELIDKKINFKENKLESLIQKLEIERPKVIQLRNAYEKLIKAKNGCNLFEIKKAEEIVEEIKNELLTEKSEGMRKIFHKCEKVAKLRLQRERVYEAKIELPSISD